MEKKYKLRKSRLFLFFFLAILVLGFFYKGQIFESLNNEKSLDSYLVMVNGESITQEQLDIQYNKLPVQYKSLITKEELLDQIISEKLLLSQITETKADESKVEAQLQQAVLSSGVTREQLKQTLISQGSSLEELKETFRKQVMINDFLEQNIFSDVIILNEDVKNYYLKNKDIFSAKEGQVSVSHILISNEESAKEILKMLTVKNFAELAKEKSIGPSASNGGSLGFVQKGQLVKEFEDVLFSLKENEISNPVKTQFGWHIIFRQTDSMPLEEVFEQIKGNLLLLKQKKVLENYVEELKSKAVINYPNKNNIKDCLSGSKLYLVSSGCKYCDEQKSAVDLSNVEVIDCLSLECDVKGFPTWEINGNKFPGFKTKEELNKLASC